MFRSIIRPIFFIIPVLTFSIQNAVAYPVATPRYRSHGFAGCIEYEPVDFPHPRSSTELRAVVIPIFTDCQPQILQNLSQAFSLMTRVESLLQSYDSEINRLLFYFNGEANHPVDFNRLYINQRYVERMIQTLRGTALLQINTIEEKIHSAFDSYDSDHCDFSIPETMRRNFVSCHSSNQTGALDAELESKMLQMQELRSDLDTRAVLLNTKISDLQNALSN